MTDGDIPTSLDELVRDARARVATMRAQLGNPADFDHMIRHALAAYLSDYESKTVAFVNRAIFGDD